MSHRLVPILAEVFTAIGTVAVAILAIWIDYFKSLFAGPQLKLSLANSQGHLIPRGNVSKAYYFHLDVTNKRTWAPAEAVRVHVTGISKRGPDGSFREEPLVYPLQLIWTPAEIHIPYQVIVDTAKCDLGFLDHTIGHFMLATAIIPNGFRGFVDPNEAIRVQIRVSAQNIRPGKTLVVEVAWDGQWADNPSEMEHHLIIKETDALA